MWQLWKLGPLGPLLFDFSAIITHLFLIIGPKSAYKIGFPASSIAQSWGLSHHFLVMFFPQPHVIFRNTHKEACTYDVCTRRGRGFPKADEVRKNSKGGCVKMQTRVRGDGQKIADVVCVSFYYHIKHLNYLQLAWLSPIRFLQCVWCKTVLFGIQSRISIKMEPGRTELPFH